jgi:Fe-S-cluster containining protein
MTAVNAPGTAAATPASRSPKKMCDGLRIILALPRQQPGKNSFAATSLKMEDKGEVEYILKHRKDHIYATICQFFDQDERRCTIYEARPSVCREYPDGKVCGYYNFLKFERKHQDDKEFIPSA